MNVKKELLIPIGLSFIVGLVIGGAIIFFTFGKKANANISLYPQKANEVGNDWLVKIDGYAISKSEFEEGYKFFLSQIPEQQRVNLPNESVLKYQVLENFITQYVLTVKALNSGIYNSPDSKLAIKLALRDAIYKLYLKSAIKDESIFKPTKAEIEDYYMRNRAQFEKMGLKAEQIKMYAEQDLYNRKLQEWIATFVNSKRQEFKIEKNDALMEKLGIPTAPPTLNLQGIQK
ncbi:MAG: hypothetical protein N2258_01990 [Brevinematales bacterium]|nr:hypothetical protein [Brevinematales bacterium]